MQKVYRVKFVIALERDGVFVHRNEFLQPQQFLLLDDALAFCSQDMEKKLREGNYFRSQIYGFDLVRYRNLARLNTYLAYRIVITNVNTALLERDFDALTYI
ncbi:MAG: hypothetical protein N2Z22_11050 [Turneriella sp.]|nr:hypothetical protein [Turneriella sp.]